MACNCISRKVAKILLWVSLITLVLSVTVIIVFPTIYNSVLGKEISLGKGTMFSNIWKDIPLPLHEKVYFFNITNRDAFLAGEEPLNLVEVGPYTYSSRWVKNNPIWNSNNTVSYREVRTYQFVRELSSGSQDEEIYTLNGPLIMAASIAKDYSETERAALSVILSIEGEKLVIKRKIRELVYDGYEDFIIKYAPLIKPDIPYKTGVFSWLWGKNATDDGLFTVFTGTDDTSKINLINNWNGLEKLPFWKGSPCDMLNGTSIETGPPIKGYQDSYTFFQTIFCRSITLQYAGEQKHYDIPSKRFVPTYDIFANKTENPDNYCYEDEKERPSGIYSLSPCQFGAPVFISFPHFYFADPIYLTSVTGLNPNNETHGSHLDVEPITGITMHTHIKFQINVELSKVTGIFQTYKPSNFGGILPVLWVDLSLEIDEHFANYMKKQLNNPKYITYSVLGVLAAISVILAIICFTVLYSTESNDDDDPLLDVKDDNLFNPATYNNEVVKENPRPVPNENYHQKEDHTDVHEKYLDTPEYTEKELNFKTPAGSPDSY